jgi:hypothetical protein
MVLIASTVLLVATISLPAAAHNYPNGSDGLPGPCNKNIKWPVASKNYYHALVWAQWITNGTSNAAASIRTTDFDWNYSSSSSNTWSDLGSSDTSIAGATQYTNTDCSVTPGKMIEVDFYWNLPHFASGHGAVDSAERTNYLQCLAAHEFAHGAGLAHNSTTSVLRTNHTTQCHTSSWRNVQPHDTTDLNAKY